MDKNCQCEKCQRARNAQREDFVDKVAKQTARTAVGLVAGYAVTSVLGPVAGEITRKAVTGDLLG